MGPDIQLDSPAFIHDSARLYGKISIGPGASVWPNVVMRSEMHEITIGARTNVQDFVMIHVGFEHPTVIGEDCSITHHATLHGCIIRDRTLVGINATVMDGTEIGANSIIAGHSIVTEGKVFPENSVIAGVPTKLVRTVDSSEPNPMNARFYHQNALNYAKGIHRLSDEELAGIGFGN